MIHVTITDAQGVARAFAAMPGTTLKDAIVEHGLPGLEALCGGAANCGTCHVYVDDAWRDRLPPPGEEEGLMLDYVMDRRADSRLSCQILLAQDIDGLTARTPERQT